MHKQHALTFVMITVFLNTVGFGVIVPVVNPDFYLFDQDKLEKGGPLQVAFTLPIADTEQLSTVQQLERQKRGEALEFSHSLQTQIGGQLEAGIFIAGFYEDRWDTQTTPLNDYMPTSMATLAVKP